MTKYGIIGYPLGHSFSRGFFTEKFARESIDAQYLNFEIPDVAMLSDVLRDNPELRGLNVTLPHKQAVIPLLDEMSEEAMEIGAVNVIRVRNGKLKGFNSDIIGFTNSIKPLLQPHHRKALVLGTGGASKAIAYSLELLGISYKFVSRSASEDNYTYDDLTEEVMKEHTVLINTSPVGTFPNVKECPNIPYHCITREHVVYDLIYNPIETMFLRQAETCGATIQNGWPMFVNQALKSYEIWEGVMWKE